MVKPSGRAASRCSAVVLAVFALGAAPNAIGAVTGARAVPPRLVGVWTRTVTEADAQRAGAGQGFVGNHGTLIIKKSGRDNATLRLGAGYNVVGDVVSAGPGRVHIQIGSPAPNVYRWKVAGRRLTFTKVSDDAPDRVVVFVGTWKRK